MTQISNVDVDELEFGRDGAKRLRSAIDARELRCIEKAVDHLKPGQAGARLYGVSALQPFLTLPGAIAMPAAAALGESVRPVRAILFDKTPTTNWSVAWHQDRTIAVAKRIEVEGFGPWTHKGGMLHVAPPFDVLARMVTLRVHLDPVPATNSPLLIAPGSHRAGRIPAADVLAVVQRCGIAACLADAGDIWLYATSILHASEAAQLPSHRRVLQVDFAADALPGGLEWLGI
jgi:hypothetical protein